MQATAALHESVGGAPIELKRLFGFQRVTLAAGASATLSFELTPEHLGLVDSEGHTSLHPADFEVVFSRGHGEELSAPVTVAPVGGSPLRLKTLRKWW